MGKNITKTTGKTTRVSSVSNAIRYNPYKHQNQFTKLNIDSRVKIVKSFIKNNPIYNKDLKIPDYTPVPYLSYKVRFLNKEINYLCNSKTNRFWYNLLDIILALGDRNEGIINQLLSKVTSFNSIKLTDINRPLILDGRLVPITYISNSFFKEIIINYLLLTKDEITFENLYSFLNFLIFPYE